MTASASMHPSTDTLPRSSTGCMRPGTRSETKSKLRTASKSKGAGEDKLKPPRSTKLPRTRPASRLTEPTRDLAPEPLYGLLWDVPESMLSSFQVVPPSQTCAANSSSPSVSDAAPLDIERFASTGPEPMFDHSWRVAFVEARIPMEENRSPQLASDQTIRANFIVPEECRNVSHSGSLTFLSSSLSPPILRDQEPSDEDASPMTLGTDVQLVDTYKRPAHVDKVTEYPSHFHPSVHVHPYHPTCSGAQTSVATPERYGLLRPDKSHPSLLQQALSPQPWPPPRAPSFMPSFPPHVPLPPALPSSLVRISDSHSPSVACDMGRTPYPQRKYLDQLRRELPPGHFSQSCLSTPPLENRSGDTLAPPYLNFRLPPPPPLTSFPLTSFPTRSPLPPLGFPPAPLAPDSEAQHTSSVTDARVLHPHPFAMQNAANMLLGQPYPVIQPAMSVPLPPMSLPVLQPTPCVPTPWCALFDDLKKRTQTDPGPAKKRRTAALTLEEADHPSSIDAGGNEQVGRVHPCPLCPRVFALPNSLALHLKWHWGASGLEWKRGESYCRVCLGRRH